jgi:hypothetical protein
LLGLVVIITIVKLTSNAMRKRKHAVGLGRYDEHLSSKEGLIPEMSEQAHFETHDVIITSPDGSEISPLSSSRGDSPSPTSRFAPMQLVSVRRRCQCRHSRLPLCTASPLSLPFVKLSVPNRQSRTAEPRGKQGIYDVGDNVSVHDLDRHL